MGDVIDLQHGQGATPATRTVRSYGSASGLEVVLFTDADADDLPLRLSLVAPQLTHIEDLVALPDSDEGRAAAEAIGAIVLHALQVAEQEASAVDAT